MSDKEKLEAEIDRLYSVIAQLRHLLDQERIATTKLEQILINLQDQKNV